MPAGGVGPGLLDQRLIVPEAHAIHARQVRGHLAEARVQNQPPHIHIVLPQVNALHKYIVVVSFFAILIHLLMQHALLAALTHGPIHGLAPRLQLVRREEVVDDGESVFPV